MANRVFLGNIMGPPGKDGHGETTVTIGPKGTIDEQIAEEINFDSDPQTQITNIQKDLAGKATVDFSYINYSNHEGYNSFYMGNPIITTDNYIKEVRGYQLSESPNNGDISIKDLDHPWNISGQLSNFNIEESWANKVPSLGKIDETFNFSFNTENNLIHYIGDKTHPVQIQGTDKIPPVLKIFSNNEFYIDVTSLCDFMNEDKYSIGMTYYSGLLTSFEEEWSQPQKDSGQCKFIIEFKDNTTQEVIKSLSYNSHYEQIIVDIKNTNKKQIKNIKFYPIIIPKEKYEITDTTVNKNTGEIFIQEIFFNDNSNIPVHLEPVFYNAEQKKYDFIHCNKNIKTYNLSMPLYSINEYHNHFIWKTKHYQYLRKDDPISWVFNKNVLHLKYNGTENWSEHVLQNGKVYYTCSTFKDCESDAFEGLSTINKDPYTNALGFCNLLNIVNLGDIEQGKEGIAIWKVITSAFGDEEYHLALYTNKFAETGSLQYFKDFLSQQNLELYTPCESASFAHLFLEDTTDICVPLTNTQDCLQVFPKDIFINFHSSFRYNDNAVAQNIENKQFINIFTSAENVDYNGHTLGMELANIHIPSANNHKENEFLQVDANGQYILSNEVVFTSANDKRWKLKISDSGTISTEEIL